MRNSVSRLIPVQQKKIKSVRRIIQKKKTDFYRIGGESVFLNPPYSEIKKWVEKAYREGIKDNTLVCMIIPARTDTSYFHDFIYHRSEIRFIRKRLRFSGSDCNAPFPSMIVIFRGAFWNNRKQPNRIKKNRRE